MDSKPCFIKNKSEYKRKDVGHTSNIKEKKMNTTDVEIESLSSIIRRLYPLGLTCNDIAYALYKKMLGKWTYRYVEYLAEHPECFELKKQFKTSSDQSPQFVAVLPKGTISDDEVKTWIRLALKDLTKDGLLDKMPSYLAKEYIQTRYYFGYMDDTEDNKVRESNKSLIF